MNVYDELLIAKDKPREFGEKIYNYFNSLSLETLIEKQRILDKTMLEMGITFNVYAESKGSERIIPFDFIPRIIAAHEWEILEKGIKQRVTALNLFLIDIYHDQKIIKDKVLDAETVTGSKGFLKACMNVMPPKKIYNHISGIDIIRDEKGDFLVLEDNIRCPSGVSYMLQNRELSKKEFSDLLFSSNVKSIQEYPEKLINSLKFLAKDPENATVALMTPGSSNSAFYEHTYLAQQMGIELVDHRDLRIKNEELVYKTISGFKKVDVLYRRIDDTFLDPDVFNKNSLIGVKGIFEIYKKGKLALANAPGTGVADDKVIYAFLPKIIKYYLSEEPILQNVHTYLCQIPTDLKFVLENLENLVVKEANEAGGYGMLIGPVSTKAEIANFKIKISENPRNYIAQPLISLSTSPCVIAGELKPRHIDLRPYAIYGDDIYVSPGGLTRVALKEGSYVVNSSQGGGSKDTWVL